MLKISLKLFLLCWMAWLNSPVYSAANVDPYVQQTDTLDFQECAEAHRPIIKAAFDEMALTINQALPKIREAKPQVILTSQARLLFFGNGTHIKTLYAQRSTLDSLIGVGAQRPLVMANGKKAALVEGISPHILCAKDERQFIDCIFDQKFAEKFSDNKTVKQKDKGKNKPSGQESKENDEGVETAFNLGIPRQTFFSDSLQSFGDVRTEFDRMQKFLDTKGCRPLKEFYKEYDDCVREYETTITRSAWLRSQAEAPSFGGLSPFLPFLSKEQILSYIEEHLDDGEGMAVEDLLRQLSKEIQNLSPHNPSHVYSLFYTDNDACRCCLLSIREHLTDKIKERLPTVKVIPIVLSNDVYDEKYPKDEANLKTGVMCRLRDQYTWLPSTPALSISPAAAGPSASPAPPSSVSLPATVEPSPSLTGSETSEAAFMGTATPPTASPTNLQSNSESDEPNGITEPPPPAASPTTLYLYHMPLREKHFLLQRAKNSGAAAAAAGAGGATLQ